MADAEERLRAALEAKRQSEAELNRSEADLYAAILACRKANMSMERIGHLLGCSRQNISKMLRKHRDTTAA